MAVGGRHGAKVKSSSPAGRSSASAPLSWAATARGSGCLSVAPESHEESPKNGARHAPSPGVRPAGCCCMAGLATFDQKNSIEETTPIKTAF